MIKILIAEEQEYEPMMELFRRNDLEISDEEPVPTDLIRCWKAENEEGIVVGGCSLAVRQDEYIIDGIAVEPEYRLDKTASRLLTEAIEETKKRGGKRIYLVARAPGFFRKHGFVPIKPEDAPDFFECRTCEQFNVKCFPEVMLLTL